MGSERPEDDSKTELNDSGCIQDEPPPKQPVAENGYVGQAQLLDLSDDVLLYILRYCSPHDLKALGFACARLGSLVLEHSLWNRIDARGVCMARARTRWILNHGIHEGTKELMITGCAKQAKGCGGHVNKTRKEAEEEEAKHKGDGNGNNSKSNINTELISIENSIDVPPQSFTHLNHMPRMSTSPCWADSDSESDGAMGGEGAADGGGPCKGPLFTMAPHILERLANKAPNLTVLYLDYCNINCNKTNLSLFPPTLKKLSLRGTRCYNLPLDKSFLFKVHDYLPVLEYLDLSECDWLEPANLLPLSKISNLQTLLMRDCMTLSEFVAYVSLASRYGFSKLQVLDVCGSPWGDSEVCALGWLPELRELYLAAPVTRRSGDQSHYHYKGECTQKRSELDPWETKVPDYYNITIDQQETNPMDMNSENVLDMNSENVLDDDMPSVRITRNSLNIAADRALDLRDATKRKSENNPKTDPEAGPSKRFKNDENERDKKCREIVALIQNNNVTVTKKKGYVTFKRTVINSNGESSKSNERNETESEHETDFLHFKKEKVDEGPNHKSYSTRVNINLDDGASTSFSVRFRVNKENEHDSDESSSSKSEDNEEKLEKPQDSNTESPDKKPKLESNDESADKSERNESAANNDGPSNAENETEQRTQYIRFRKTIAHESADRSDRNENAANNEGPSNVENETQYIRFRRSQPPIQVMPLPRPEQAQPNQEQAQPNHEQAQPNQEQAQPRHHILYVNLGRQIHAVFSGPMFQSIGHNLSVQRLEFSTLVSDSAIRRFGRADGEDVNIVNIGPNGPQFGGRDTSGRPNRSNLRVLSATGYRNITNRSLVHLATAAPFLERIDFSNTSVTETGVEQFKSLRPDCEVIFSKFKQNEE